MSDALFQQAYARARSRFSDDAWLVLNPRQITEAIYREIREIDAERVAALGDTVVHKSNVHGSAERNDSA